MLNKTNVSKERDIYHYWYFLNKVFKFQRFVCNGRHDILLLINLNGITILHINRSDYLCIINGISKSDALNLFKNVDLTEKGVL